ncbi:phosducin family protein [Peziza echinospora]|nr:phosducin family protein [Peziza echinospora]
MGGLPDVQVPIDDPNADTEWNDILRKHGVIPERPPSPTAGIEAAILEAEAQLHEHRLSPKNLDELDELEDDEDPEFLEMYKQKRLQELRELGRRSNYGQVYPLSKPTYTRDVTEESEKEGGPVVFVHLANTSSAESKLLSQLWRTLAQKFGDVKFCEIRAEMAIEGYPAKNTPTILVYRKGDIVRQVVTLRELGGMATRIRDLEMLLQETGAVGLSDARLKRGEGEGEEEEEERRVRTVMSGQMGEGSTRRGGNAGWGAGSKKARVDDDDDDDW